MTVIKLNARDMIIEVLSGPATYTEIAGLTSFNYKPDENEEKADTTTFSDAGNYREEKMQKGASTEVEGFKMKDDVTAVPDPGQGYVEQWHELLGPESVGGLRFRHVDDTVWKVWECTVTLGEQGGENNDKTGWSATFMRCGASTDLAVA